MSRISSRSSFVAVVVSVATVLASSGCTRMIQMDTVKTSITDGVASQVGLHAESVTCPAERALQANDAFECTVVPKEGGKLTIAVTQKDDQGNIEWKVTKTEGLLDLSKVEAAVTQGLREQANAEATVSCGGRWKGAKKGDAFDCEAKTAAGDTVGILVQVTDDEGNIQWGTK